MIAYLDSSALVKLIVEEPESEALEVALRDWPDRATSALARVEVGRAARAAGLESRVVDPLLAGVSVLPIDDRLLTAATLIDPIAIRSLDAVHLATAASLGDALEVLVCYRRMQTAAVEAGLPTASPA